jgi:hypothetical protein
MCLGSLMRFELVAEFFLHLKSLTSLIQLFQSLSSIFLKCLQCQSKKNSRLHPFVS